jgi:hypothetical protein
MMKCRLGFIFVGLCLSISGDYAGALKPFVPREDPLGGAVDAPLPPSVPTATAAPFGPGRPIRVLQIQLGGDGYFKAVTQELQTAQPGLPPAAIQYLDWPEDGANPFGISHYNFDVGPYRLSPDERGKAPLITPQAHKWFASQVAQGLVPDVVIIGGHHAPGLGWHSHFIKNDNYYERSLVSTRLFASARRFKVVRDYFANVKMAVIGGCWALANLEPHGRRGEYLSPSDIARIYFTGAPGRAAMLGEVSDPHTLAFQRHELTTLYSNRYKPTAELEDCSRPTKKYCHTFHVDRVLPDYALFDGSHTYNAASLMRRLFPNAAMVIGFHSPSPYANRAGAIYRSAFANAREDLRHERINGQPVASPLRALIDSGISKNDRRRILNSLRVQWTRATYRMNRGRTAGSITPAFPDLDADGLFAYYPTDPELPLGPKFRPYRPQH